MKEVFEGLRMQYTKWLDMEFYSIGEVYSTLTFSKRKDLKEWKVYVGGKWRKVKHSKDVVNLYYICEKGDIKTLD